MAIALPSARTSEDAGAAAVEFVLVGLLLTFLTLGVIQLGVAVYVRNVVHDAAVEGAHRGALADASPAEGAQRTRELIGRAVGESFAQEVSAQRSGELGYPTVRVTVRARLPLVGLLGPAAGMEVQAHAPLESFD